MATASTDLDYIAERRQVAATGMMADDVVLGTFSYPDLADEERVALGRFRDLLQGFAEAEGAGAIAVSLPRMMSMAALSDSLAPSLKMTGEDGQVIAEHLVSGVDAILKGEADEATLKAIRGYADSLARVSSDRSQDLQRGRRILGSSGV